MGTAPTSARLLCTAETFFLKSAGKPVAAHQRLTDVTPCVAWSHVVSTWESPQVTGLRRRGSFLSCKLRSLCTHISHHAEVTSQTSCCRARQVRALARGKTAPLLIDGALCILLHRESQIAPVPATCPSIWLGALECFSCLPSCTGICYPLQSPAAWGGGGGP
jgi:hypothetical protein